jgi:hypothetical protein
VTLVINGASFGSAQALVFVGTGQCANVKHDFVTPQSKLSCLLPPGKGTDVAVQV